VELGKSTGTGTGKDDIKMPTLKRQRASCNYAEKPPLAPKKKRRKLRQVVPVMYIDDKWWDAELRMTDPFDVRMTDPFDDDEVNSCS
jgi:hypothetical protein